MKYKRIRPYRYDLHCSRPRSHLLEKNTSEKRHEIIEIGGF